jgi:hypothetical protein
MEAELRKAFLSFVLGVAWLGFASNAAASPVEYTKICPIFGDGYYYVPGTDWCFNPVLGEVRKISEVIEIAGVPPVTTQPTWTWRTRFPYPQGSWVLDPADACQKGRLVKIASVQAQDFVVETLQRFRSPGFPLQLKANEMITQIIMSGGFYDPRRPPTRSGVSFSTDGWCVRSIDPTVLFAQPGGPPLGAPYGNGGLPIACIGRSRTLNMPGAFAVPATAAYPDTSSYFLTADQKSIAGPYVYGKQLVVTNDLNTVNYASLSYCEPVRDIHGDIVPDSCPAIQGGAYDSATKTFTPFGPGQKFFAGTLNVWACVENGSNSQGENNQGNSDGQ